MADGEIDVYMTNLDELPDDKKIASIENEIRQHFLSCGIFSAIPFELSRWTGSDFWYPNGNKGAIATAKPIVMKIKRGQADFVIKDEYGNIIRDSKAERLAQLAEFSALFRRRSHDVDLLKMGDSFLAALRDEANMLVHLYEILDTLMAKYGGRGSALQTLGLDEAQWNRLHKLANDEPLEEGRHRGSRNVLRKATMQERDEAEQIGRTIIEKYLKFLDGTVNVSETNAHRQSAAIAASAESDSDQSFIDAVSTVK